MIVSNNLSRPLYRSLMNMFLNGMKILFKLEYDSHVMKLINLVHSIELTLFEDRV